MSKSEKEISIDNLILKEKEVYPSSNEQYNMRKLSRKELLKLKDNALIAKDDKTVSIIDFELVLKDRMQYFHKRRKEFNDSTKTMNFIGSFLSIIIPLIYAIPFFLVFKEESDNTLIVILSFLACIILSFLNFILVFHLIANMFHKKIDKQDEDLRDDAGIYRYLLNEFYPEPKFNREEYLD